MPSKGRKKKSHSKNPSQSTIVYTKRQEIQDEDGWTHVVDAPRKRRSTLTKAANGGLHAGDFEINGVGYVNRTIEEMSKEFEFWKKQWETDVACAKLQELLSGKEDKITQGGIVKPLEEKVSIEENPREPEVKSQEDTQVKDSEKEESPNVSSIKTRRPTVDNIVVFGLGSLQSARREGRRATLTQLAALQTMVDVLEPLSDSIRPLRVIFQEPHFTPLDIEYLQTFSSYEIVDDPEAFNRITEGSLVYAVHCYSDVYRKVAEAARPAILIGTDIGNFGRFNVSEIEAETQRQLEALIKDCDVLDFPQVRHDFSDTKIYWRMGTTNSTT